MDEFYFRKRHIVPAFGSWECNNEYEYGYDDNGEQFTQCFESARQAGLFRYSYSESEERDLYVAGDLYENDVLTPAVIVVPRRRPRRGKGGDSKKERWVVCDSDCEGELKAAPSPDSASLTAAKAKAKAIDEDLYKISPHDLLRAQTKRKRAWGFFSSCLQPTCVC
ncbi:hypothetical protein ACJIZ3_017756 [Penstemon smallii]|uniref:Uncharacterized protein n=1 Tax=Penstemon smallii TaxID=265156 RepID=A0ABD3SWF9_9LAMI